MSKFKKILSILTLTAILMAVFSVSVYGSILKPKMLDKFVELGNKYLQDGKYEEAILQFSKAIQIDEKNILAQVGTAEALVALDKIDDALKILAEIPEIEEKKVSFKLSTEEETQMLDMIERLKDVDPQAAYTILQNYMTLKGNDPLPGRARDFIASAQESPLPPSIDIAPGTYVEPITVALQTNTTLFGHQYFYTLDGSEPDRTSNVYKEPIRIAEGSVSLKMVGYNPENESSNVMTVQYTVNPQPLQLLQTTLNEAKKVYDSTTEGTGVGNSIPGAKQQLLEAINNADSVVKGSDLKIEPVQEAYSILSKEIEVFKEKIVTTDKTALRNAVNEARNLLESSVEGTESGQFKVGSKAILNDQISQAQAVLNDALAEQEVADAALNNLNAAIQTFEGSKVWVQKNPDGTQFSFGYQTLMGEETSRTFTGRFTAIASGTASLKLEKEVQQGDTGSIYIQLTRNENTVTVSTTETWDNDGSKIYSVGTWYASYNGSDNSFVFYSAEEGVNSADRYEGTYSNGVLIGRIYLNGIGYALDFSAK